MVVHRIVLVLVLLSLTSLTYSTIGRKKEEYSVFNIPIPVQEEKIIIEILNFSIESILKIYEEAEIQKTQQEILEHFKEIDQQLKEVRDSIVHIIEEIKILEIKIIYSDAEDAILTTLTNYGYYASEPDNEAKKKIFFDEAVELPNHINKLMKGLLGIHSSHVDIMNITRDNLHCHGRKLQEEINSSYMSIVMAGTWLYFEHQQIINATGSNNSHLFQWNLSFKDDLLEMSEKLIKRLDEQVFQCRMDERSVTTEMKDIIKDTFKQGREKVTNALLDFLDDKYDTKNWTVIVALETFNKVNAVQSAGFHTVSADGMFAAVASFFPNPELFAKVKARMKDFKFPIQSKYSADISYYLAEKVAARDVYDYLNRFMSPLRTNRSEAIIESLIIETPCTSTEEDFDSLVSVVSSNDTEYVALNNNGSHCINHLVVIVPVKPFNSTATAVQDLKCYTDGVQNGLLRNEFGQGYLSVLDNSLKEEAYIILDRTWKNVTGQRWRFVDNHLVNDHGKCLTAWKLTSTYLYQYDCHIDWVGQIWYRHGLNIVNGFNFCLAFKSKPNDAIMFLVQAQCDSTPPYLWYDWDVDCEDAMVVPSIGNESRPLKNEFTRRYLTVYNDGYYALNEPWNNEAGQNWKFIDGQLKNDYEKCLAGKSWYQSWYVYQTNCDLPTTKWTYNEKKQIVNSVSGYCLSTGNIDGYIYYSTCHDGPEYRWL